MENKLFDEIVERVCKSDKNIWLPEKNEGVELLKKYFPLIYESYDRLLVTLTLTELRLKKGYPSVFFSAVTKRHLDIMIDFSFECSFFFKIEKNKDIVTTYSASFDKVDNCPITIESNELIKWLPYIVIESFQRVVES